MPLKRHQSLHQTVSGICMITVLFMFSIPVNADELQEAYEAYQEAFTRYTEAVTSLSGSGADVDTLLHEYRSTYARYKALKNAQGDPSAPSMRNLDTSGIDGITDIEETSEPGTAENITADQYRYGIGVAIDHEKAIALYQKQNDANAWQALANYYLDGIWLPQDHRKAEELLVKAAAEGSISAQWQLDYLQEKKP